MTINCCVCEKCIGQDIGATCSLCGDYMHTKCYKECFYANQCYTITYPTNNLCGIFCTKCFNKAKCSKCLKVKKAMTSAGCYKLATKCSFCEVCSDCLQSEIFKTCATVDCLNVICLGCCKNEYNSLLYLCKNCIKVNEAYDILRVSDMYEPGSANAQHACQSFNKMLDTAQTGD
jgi:hypothetical protein